MMSVWAELTCDRKGCENSLKTGYTSAKNSDEFKSAYKNIKHTAVNELKWVFYSVFAEKTTFTFCSDECCELFKKERENDAV